MFQFRVTQKRGTITVILIGIVSVMLLFTVALSRRMSGHTQLLTLGDYTQIARYFLESYVNDILRQIKIQANDPDSDVYKKFREVPGDVSLPSSSYSPSDLLVSLQKELEIEFDGDPTISITDVKPLKYPPSIACPPDKLGIEKRALLNIACSAKFRERKFTLEVNYPFVTSFRLTPILKDFVFFADKIHLEQRSKFGPQDKINSILIKDALIDENSLKRPWIFFWPKTPTLENTGKVFLGEDDKMIYLNLAGSVAPEGLMSDMFHVLPAFFKVADPEKKFEYQPLFMKEDLQSYVTLYGLDVELKLRGHLAKLGVIGFCQELMDDSSLFDKSSRKLDDFLRDDPSFAELTSSSRESLALSSGLKFCGLNAAPEEPTANIIPRQVFGKVAARFVLLTFFEYPSAQGGGQALPYNDNFNAAQEFPKFFGEDPVTFQPVDDSQSYSDFMSRIVSGGADFSGGPFPETYMPYNPPNMSGTKTALTHVDFLPPDGFRLKEPFSSVSRQWFDIQAGKRFDDETLEGVQARITRYFSNQDEFKKYAGISAGRFWVDGVVYVAGDLDLDDLTMPNEEIRGGVVIADGKITLKNITRGLNLNVSPPKYTENAVKEIEDFIETVKQDNFLTFVSLRSLDGITLKGGMQIGVQLVSMHPDTGNAADQIKWDTRDPIVFCGGIAVNTPNLEKRLEEIANAGMDFPYAYFNYVPSMADPAPSVVAGVMSHMRGYTLTSGLGQDE